MEPPVGSEHPEKILLCLVFAGWSFFWRSKLKLLVLSIMMSGTTKPQAYDARVYNVCAPWARSLLNRILFMNST